MKTAGSLHRRASGPDRRIRPIERVQRPSEFHRAMRGGRSFRDPLLRIHFIENGRELSRLGLVVSRKMGNAVVRNRLKRILRELFREMKSKLPFPLDLVIVPNYQAGPKDFRAYRGIFERFVEWSRSRLGQKSPGEAR